MPENKHATHTDLAKLDAHEVQPEEYEDIPELTDEFFDNAEIRLGEKLIRPARRPGRPQSETAKKLVSLRLDPDIIERFRATGPGWQSRINAAHRHPHPDDEEIGIPHLHLYREGFGDKWAMPLPPEMFRNPAHVWMTFEDFLQFCNITQPPHVERGLFT